MCTYTPSYIHVYIVCTYVCTYTYLGNFMNISADLSNMVRSLKQPLTVKLPASITSRLLNLLPHLQVGLLPCLQHAAGVRRLLLDISQTAPVARSIGEDTRCSLSMYMVYVYQHTEYFTWTYTVSTAVHDNLDTQKKVEQHNKTQHKH